MLLFSSDVRNDWVIQSELLLLYSCYFQPSASPKRMQIQARLYTMPLQWSSGHIKGGPFGEEKRTLDLQGTLSWCPIDEIVTALSEMLLSKQEEPPNSVLNLENPPRQPWLQIVRRIASTFRATAPCRSRTRSPYYGACCCRGSHLAENTSGSSLAAATGVDFLEKHFVRKSCGELS